MTPERQGLWNGADSEVIGVSACWIMGIVMCIFLLPVIDRTPGSTGYKRPWLLKRFRYLVERFDPLLEEVLQRYREKVKMAIRDTNVSLI